MSRRSIILTSVLAAALLAPAYGAGTRIKDIAKLRGVRENQLMGYGIVTGLNGTGDKRQTIFTLQSLTNMLQKMGISADPKTMRVQNIAAVMVTAVLPPFPRAGQNIDVTVASIGDAKSIQGGILLSTPLKGLDGQIYAMAQGPLLLGGFSAGGGGAATNKVVSNHPTVGRIPSGAIVEREIPLSLEGADTLVYTLDQDDFTTASAIARAVNGNVQPGIAHALDSRTIAVKVPEAYKTNPVEFISRIETLGVETDEVARVVMDERTGTIILGQELRVSPVAVMHGNLSVEITTDLSVSQPAPFSGGTTTVTPDTTVQASEEKARSLILGRGTTVDDLVKALNGIGATPRDIISILSAMRAAGAIKAAIITI